MLVSQVIDRATRLLFAGQTLTGTQAANALASFQDMMRDLPGVIGAKWTDVVGHDGYVAGEDERIACYSAMSIKVPDFILKSDGAGVPSTDTFNSTTMRTPNDGARVQIVDFEGTEKLWFYRADRAAWFGVDALTAGSDVPLSAEFDRYLPSMLAIHMRPEYVGSNLDKATAFLAEKGYAKLRARLRKASPVRVELALLHRSIQTGQGTCL